jgi:hypothetical protein
VLTLLLVPELAAPVSAAHHANLFLPERIAPAALAGGRNSDSSDGLIDAQITRRHGTVHRRPATNPTTPPAPLASSVAPTCPFEGLRASGNMPGTRVRG